LHFDSLDRETFESLLRGGARRQVVDAVLATCLSRSLDHELVLRLEPAGDQAMALGGDAPGSLGRFAWLTARQDEALTASFAGGVQC
jgi:predicted component of type VI protein secretion system